MTLLLLANLGFAGGDGLTAPIAFGDLTTLFTAYVQTLRNANPTKVDSDTLIAKDLATVRSGNPNLDDANTLYAYYLS